MKSEKEIKEILNHCLKSRDNIKPDEVDVQRKLGMENEEVS